MFKDVRWESHWPRPHSHRVSFPRRRCSNMLTWESGQLAFERRAFLFYSYRCDGSDKYCRDENIKEFSSHCKCYETVWQDLETLHITSKKVQETFISCILFYFPTLLEIHVFTAIELKMTTGTIFCLAVCCVINIRCSNWKLPVEEEHEEGGAEREGK